MSDTEKSTILKATDARKPMAMTPVPPVPEERGRQTVAMTPVTPIPEALEKGRQPVAMTPIAQPPVSTPANVPASQPPGEGQAPAQNSKK